jgi:hypothetical protein
MFKCVELPWLIQFFLMFYNDKPVDWLLDHMIHTKICSLDKDSVSSVLSIDSRHAASCAEPSSDSVCFRNIARKPRHSCGFITNLRFSSTLALTHR